MSIFYVFVVVFLFQITLILSKEEELLNVNRSIEVAKLSHGIENVCLKALGGDQSKDLNYFSYGCFLKKFNESESETVIEDFKLCCDLLLSKNKENEELDCPNRFCNCIDMINIVHGPFIKECTSSKLPQCEITSSPWGHMDNLREDVGIILVLNKNVLLGGGGIAIFTILCFISLCGFGYLVFICVLYRCCKSNKNDEIYQDEEYYAENATFDGAVFDGYELSDGSVAATTITPQNQTETTQTITIKEIQINQPNSTNSGSSNTKTKEIINTVSVDNN
uniref:Uncharacterized protein n=1 Tax=Panagrolaimus davidi TaxID=227884 RepID=A0A914PB07_9BILA